MSDLEGKRILVVDDDSEIRFLLETILDLRGAQVFTAADGVEGLRRFHECQPDLVLLDVNMPRMDGWQTCSRIRELSNVPIIFVTAQGRPKDISRGFDIGAVDYICKPFRTRAATARICAVLDAAEASPASNH